MKKFLLTFLFFTMITLPVMAQDKTDDIIVEVKGMVCDFCAQSLKKVFGKEDSVHDISVNLDDQTVTIDTKESQELSDKKIKELIEWGGYDLVSIKRN